MKPLIPAPLPLGFYDAILMDIRMPVMTGYQASEAIRALERSDSNLPIIAMTIVIMLTMAFFHHFYCTFAVQRPLRVDPDRLERSADIFCWPRTTISTGRLRRSCFLTLAWSCIARPLSICIISYTFSADAPLHQRQSAWPHAHSCRCPDIS